MIEPTRGDIGRKVVYSAQGYLPAEGVISSINDTYVFVRYGTSAHSQATYREDLEFLTPAKETA